MKQLRYYQDKIGNIYEVKTDLEKEMISTIVKKQDEIDKYKEVIDKIKEYCNNRLDYYQEMRTDYMKEFDGYAENDNENILELLEEIE